MFSSGIRRSTDQLLNSRANLFSERKQFLAFATEVAYPPGDHSRRAILRAFIEYREVAIVEVYILRSILQLLH